MPFASNNRPLNDINWVFFKWFFCYAKELIPQTSYQCLNHFWDLSNEATVWHRLLIIHLEIKLHKVPHLLYQGLQISSKYLHCKNGVQPTESCIYFRASLAAKNCSEKFLKFHDFIYSNYRGVMDIRHR